MPGLDQPSLAVISYTAPAKPLHALLSSDWTSIGSADLPAIPSHANTQTTMTSKKGPCLPTMSNQLLLPCGKSSLCFCLTGSNPLASFAQKITNVFQSLVTALESQQISLSRSKNLSLEIG